MKSLTKVFLLVIFVAFAAESFAQVNFGVKAGLNLGNLTMKNDEFTMSEDFKSKIGFQFGPVVEFGFNDLISLETGMLLSTKGARQKEEEEGYTNKGSINIMYLNVPINARLGFDVGGMKIYGALGPYIGVGLSAKSKWEIESDEYSNSDSEKLEFGNDEEESDLKRFDYGLSIGAGVAIKALEIGLNYDLGLANLSPYTENGTKFSTKTFCITAAFKFGK